MSKLSQSRPQCPPGTGTRDLNSGTSKLGCSRLSFLNCPLQQPQANVMRGHGIQKPWSFGRGNSKLRIHNFVLDWLSSPSRPWSKWKGYEQFGSMWKRRTILIESTLSFRWFSLWAEKKLAIQVTHFFCRSGFENYWFWGTRSPGTWDPSVNTSPSLCLLLTFSLLTCAQQIRVCSQCLSLSWGFSVCFSSPTCSLTLPILDPCFHQGPSRKRLFSGCPSLSLYLYYYTILAEQVKVSSTVHFPPQLFLGRGWFCKLYKAERFLCIQPVMFRIEVAASRYLTGTCAWHRDVHKLLVGWTDVGVNKQKKRRGNAWVEGQSMNAWETFTYLPRWKNVRRNGWTKRWMNDTYMVPVKSELWRTEIASVTWPAWTGLARVCCSPRHSPPGSSLE